MSMLGSLEVLDGSNPTITAQLGVSDWYSLDAISYAILTYYFEVVPKDPSVVVLTVPITLATSGKLSISLSGLATVHANVWAKYYDEQSPFFLLSSSGPGDQVHAETYYRYTPPNQVRSITMYAGGGFYSNNRDTGQMTAVMDPRIQVDPLATFVWNGNNLLYSDYFSLEFSEGFAAAPPSPTIPEPASFALMTIGLAGTAVAAFRRRRDSK
ncbi:MAG: PEP-CTERM sorting domain-containing protein [Acidobacteriia bacterium]|nr:PEP-CTERM sorting domain-containing protein [Terriglobia bacterium]